jgi:hypothetical protein
MMHAPPTLTSSHSKTSVVLVNWVDLLNSSILNFISTGRWFLENSLSDELLGLFVSKILTSETTNKKEAAIDNDH